MNSKLFALDKTSKVNLAWLAIGFYITSSFINLIPSLSHVVSHVYQQSQTFLICLPLSHTHSLTIGNRFHDTKSLSVICKKEVGFWISNKQKTRRANNYLSLKHIHTHPYNCKHPPWYKVCQWFCKSDKAVGFWIPHKQKSRRVND